MNKSIAELENALAFWLNVRWTARDEETRDGAHSMVLAILADLAAAKAQEKWKAHVREQNELEATRDKWVA